MKQCKKPDQDAAGSTGHSTSLEKLGTLQNCRGY